MGKHSLLNAILRLGLVITFCYVVTAAATAEVSGSWFFLFCDNIHHT